MSNIIKTKKTIVIRDCVVGKKCDVCGKDIPPIVILDRCGEPGYDYYEVKTHHNDWGNDSVDSYEYFDACSPDCAYKLWEEYIRDSAGARNTKCIEVKHINCWLLKDTEVTEDT